VSPGYQRWESFAGAVATAAFDPPPTSRNRSAHTDIVERMVPVNPHYQLWVEDSGDTQSTSLLLTMGANASGIAWPEQLIGRLAEHHRVIRYDHRDTGRSTWSIRHPPLRCT
jgi:hypothetical protein